MTDDKDRSSVRIGIVGAGAIGGNVGGMLAHAGFDVTLVDQWPEHVVAVKENGLIVERRSEVLVTHPLHSTSTNSNSRRSLSTGYSSPSRRVIQSGRRC